MKNNPSNPSGEAVLDAPRRFDVPTEVLTPGEEDDAENAPANDVLDLDKNQEQRIKWFTSSFRNAILRAWAGTASPRAAIKAQCIECMGCDREAIGYCNTTTCPLNKYRPYQKDGAVRKPKAATAD